MAFMEWQDKYSTGIMQIDLEHKRLVALINELYEAMNQGKGDEALGKVLNGLASYCRTHFSNEERLMQQHGYPAYTDHKGVHDRLTTKVTGMLKDFQAGKGQSTVQTVNFLKDWLNKHILETDQKYAPFLREKGVR
jgi:hemerythrin